MNNDLILTWVAVTDRHGSARLEARWTEAPRPHASHTSHAA